MLHVKENSCPSMTISFMSKDDDHCTYYVLINIYKLCIYCIDVCKLVLPLLFRSSF